MSVTRFRPTPYADMHIGHVWTAWHNWQAARHSGGRFLVVFDDEAYNRQNLWRQSWSVETACERWLEDLRWLGMEPDAWFLSTRWHNEHLIAASCLGIAEPQHTMNDSFALMPLQSANRETVWDHYSPWMVVCRVVDDYQMGVTGFWRGNDLAHEAQLYDFMARILGYNPPGQSYIASVRREGNLARETKSGGALSVRELRDAGYEAWQIISTLRWAAAQPGGSGQVVIPAGYLEPGAIRWRDFDFESARAELLALDRNLPWANEVRAGFTRKLIETAKGAEVRVPAVKQAWMDLVEKIRGETDEAKRKAIKDYPDWGGDVTSSPRNGDDAT